MQNLENDFRIHFCIVNQKVSFQPIFDITPLKNHCEL